MASTGYAYDSNVFALPSGTNIPPGNGSTSRQDSDLSYLAHLGAVYKWSQQELDLEAQGDRQQYLLHSQLDHEDYLFKGALKWKVGPVVDGVLSLTDTRSMVPFSDITTAAVPGARNSLFIDTGYTASGTINVLVAPEWRASATLTQYGDDSPRPAETDLKLHETTSAISAAYLGFGPVTAGVRAEYLTGGFDNVLPGELSTYHQDTVEMTSTYVATGLSSFNGALGYTRRSGDGGSYVASGVTGALGYKRELTGKTQFSIDLSRGIDTYVSTNGASTDTRAAVGVLWRATSRIGVRLNWSFVHSSYDTPPQEALILDGTTQSRVDRFQTTTLGADYQVLEWLVVHAYGTLQHRGSTLSDYEYSATLAGLSLEAHLR